MSALKNKTISEKSPVTRSSGQRMPVRYSLDRPNNIRAEPTGKRTARVNWFWERSVLKRENTLYNTLHRRLWFFFILSWDTHVSCGVLGHVYKLCRLSSRNQSQSSTTTRNTAEIQNFIYFHGLCYDEPCYIFLSKICLFCKLADLCVHQMQGEKKLWNFSSGQRVKLSNK